MAAWRWQVPATFQAWRRTKRDLLNGWEVSATSTKVYTAGTKVYTALAAWCASSVSRDDMLSTLAMLLPIRPRPGRQSKRLNERDRRRQVVEVIAWATNDVKGTEMP